MTAVPQVGQWYVSRLPAYGGQSVTTYFRVLGVAAQTVDIVDPDGVRRTVNRGLFEAECEPTRKAPAWAGEGGGS